jgi:hypothetical protein
VNRFDVAVIGRGMGGWGAPMGIWAYIGGLDHFGHPANHIWPILLGLGGHMMNSMIIGIVFVALMGCCATHPAR